MTYQPSAEILNKYAKLLVKFAANSGNGVKPKEKVMLNVSESAKPLLIELVKEVLAAGAYPIIWYQPDPFMRTIYDNASLEQLNFFPDKYYKGLVDEMDHLIAIRGEANKQELKGVDPLKLLARQKSFKPYMDARRIKEDKGLFTWVLANYGTQSAADEAKLTLEEYWHEIINACYLDQADPIKKWQEIFAFQESTKAKLNALKIQSLHIKSQSTDLHVEIGPNRAWMGGSGRNIPSFEIFISPDWRKTNGYIQFTEPVYIYGNLVKDAYLAFEDGLVIKATASSGEDVFKTMIAQENANKIGEFSLTDARLSRITKFMADTLYDENVGGKFGNTHVALGNAYTDSYTGDPSTITDAQWKDMGYNNSAVHTDIVSTENRIVTATLMDGSKKIIYQDGKFMV
jgi:aminopeptidase